MAIQTLLDPALLSRLSNLELVARSVVDGFLTGLHRSPLFGFSLEFAEYRPYVQGDDPRFIDWNVFSRTERTYIKRYLGETNTHLVILFDASASMGFGSPGGVSKIQYARFLASALAYLSIRQHDAAGLIIFDNKVRSFRPPSTRPGHLLALLHMLEQAEPATTTNIELPFEHFQQHLTHRGLVAVISDLYADPERVLKAVRPLAYHGQDLVFFHILDPAELQPTFNQSTLLEDMETGDQIEVSADYARKEYAKRIKEHSEAMKTKAQDVGADYMLLNTAEPLDLALREYLLFRQRRR
jgi:uncharacterized protein (DUF58 family)